jgi:hypothetical protein
MPDGSWLWWTQDKSWSWWIRNSRVVVDVSGRVVVDARRADGGGFVGEGDGGAWAWSWVRERGNGGGVVGGGMVVVSRGAFSRYSKNKNKKLTFFVSFRSVWWPFSTAIKSVDLAGHLSSNSLAQHLGPESRREQHRGLRL